MGVFPYDLTRHATGCGLPHARGGVSKAAQGERIDGQSSPRPWGCFSHSIAGRCFGIVFPTPVGVFLQRQVEHKRIASLPHTRGLATLHDVRWKR